MIMNVYGIKDLVSEEYGFIFTARNDGVALRNFRQSLVSAPNPEEYRLYLIGTFDNEDGSIAAEKIMAVPLNAKGDV